MRLIAVDPGWATGIVHVGVTDNGKITILHQEVVPYLELARFGSLAQEHPDIYVIEDFRLSAGNEFVADTHAERVIGIFEFISAMGSDKPPVVFRSRADKIQVPDQLLKDHGLWTHNYEVEWEDARDVNDAMKHALGYLAFDQPLDRARKVLKRYFSPIPESGRRSRGQAPC